MQVEEMLFVEAVDKKGRSRLEVQYFDVNAEVLKESFFFESSEDGRAFYYNFVRMHLRIPEKKIAVRSVGEALKLRPFFRQPLYVIARKKKQF